MTNFDNQDQQLVIFYGVNNSVIAYSNAIEAILACKFNHPGWARFVC